MTALAREEANKAVLCRWYEEMWLPKVPELIMELVGPVYRRHEMGGTRNVTPEQYLEQTRALMEHCEFSGLRYQLIAEGDRVCAAGCWKVNGEPWCWTQVFRLEQRRLVETWLSGIVVGPEQCWAGDALPGSG